MSERGHDDRSNTRAVRPRVLVIDDEALLGQTIRLGLEGSVEVELETSGQSGLQRALTGGFDLILCDLSLPDVTGMAIYDRVARERPELVGRFVVMTGGAANDETSDFLDRYEGHLLSKPFTLRHVEGLVRQLLDD